MKNITRLFDILPYYQEHFPDQKVALAAKFGNSWKTYSIDDYIEAVDHVSYGLLHIGLKAGDKVALISSNCPEWNILDMAIMRTGGIPVPVYPTISESDYRYILSHAEVRFIFLEDKEILRKMRNVLSDCPKIEKVYTFRPCVEYPVLEILMEEGKSNPDPGLLQQRMDRITPGDTACLIYTSGTTGFPKGVMQTHLGILTNLWGVMDTPSDACRVAFSFLPMCHAYEKMLIYLYQLKGMSVYYAQSLATLVENLKEVRPNMMSAVPRLLEKIYDRFYAAGRSLPPIQKKLYYWAFNLAKKYQIEGNSPLYMIRWKIADILIYRKLRKAIGAENFEILVSGGAAIKSTLASFFSAIGMPVFEGYGLTETCPIIAVHNSRKGGRRVGTVGLPLKGVEVKIAEDGEILSRGAQIMAGYYKEDALTHEVIDEEGWFHTGDLGRFDNHGHLIITGRKKSLFKTSFGKYINPQSMEDKFSESPLIEQIIVLGENQKFPAALIVPDFNFLKVKCAEEKIVFSTPEEMISKKEIKKWYQDEISRYNEYFGEVEKIKKFLLIADEWSQATGILTPTLKIKRNVVSERYASVILSLFS